MPIKYHKTNIEGLFQIENFYADDQRGTFVKDFHHQEFLANNLEIDFKEMYYSVSHKNVIRGMHFQTPPESHYKLVNVIQGSIIDVVVDLRNNSSTLGQFRVFELNDTNHHSLYIPSGLAHGFMSLEENTIVSYKVSSVYSPECDQGIRFDSFGYDWNGVQSPIMSERDKGFEPLSRIIKKRYF